MRMFRLLFALLGALSVLVLVPSTAYACSCASDSVRSNVDHADLVVIGTVDDMDKPFLSMLGSSSGDPVTYNVAVDEVLKGESGPFMEVESAASGASCGLEVEVGRRYALFASAGGDGTYRASLCGGTGTATADYVHEVEAVTGPGEPPDMSIPPSEDRPPVTGMAVGVLGAGAVVGASVVLLRRWRTRGSPEPLRAPFRKS